MNEHIQKEKRAVDFLPNQPYHALEKIWEERDLIDVTCELDLWLYMALSHDKTKYLEVNQRASFLQFYYDFYYLIETSYFLNLRQIAIRDMPENEIEPFLSKEYLSTDTHRLQPYHVEDPFPVIQDFIRKYSLEYIRIELWDFFDAVQLYDGPLATPGFRKYTHTFWQFLTCISDCTIVITSLDHEDLTGSKFFVKDRA